MSDMMPQPKRKQEHSEIYKRVEAEQRLITAQNITHLLVVLCLVGWTALVIAIAYIIFQ